jgi:phospholipid N-methyltransferase
MIGLILLLAVVIVSCFGFVLLRGAPYLPTLSKQVGTALNMIDLERGDTILELGCGDGKVLIAAAEHFGPKSGLPSKEYSCFY